MPFVYPHRSNAIDLSMVKGKLPYDSLFPGTSAAAPEAAGVFALALEAK